MYPQIKIANMIHARFNNTFIIKDMELLEETKELWNLKLTIAGPFEEMEKKIVIKKDAYFIWQTLEEGMKWTT